MEWSSRKEWTFMRRFWRFCCFLRSFSNFSRLRFFFLTASKRLVFDIRAGRRRKSGWEMRQNVDAKEWQCRGSKSTPSTPSTMRNFRLIDWLNEWVMTDEQDSRTLLLMEWEIHKLMKSSNYIAHAQVFHKHKRAGNNRKKLDFWKFWMWAAYQPIHLVNPYIHWLSRKWFTKLNQNFFETKIHYILDYSTESKVERESLRSMQIWTGFEDMRNQSNESINQSINARTTLWNLLDVMNDMTDEEENILSLSFTFLRVTSRVELAWRSVKPPGPVGLVMSQPCTTFPRP